jgi:hypothetical protein
VGTIEFTLQRKSRGDRRCLRRLVLLLASLCLTLPRGEAGPEHRLHGAAGREEARVLLPRERAFVVELPVPLPSTLRAAIDEFRAVLEERAGGELRWVETRGAGSGPPADLRFRKRSFPERGLRPRGADDRFDWVVRRDGIRIEAVDALGWEYGLYAFLEEAGGVHWFWPGRWGRSVPEGGEWQIPFGRRSERPAYVSRGLRVGGGEAGRLWERRNRLVFRYRYSHHLRNLFDREFFLAHPEALGERWDPADPPPPGDPLWRSQPDFTQEVTVERAAEAAIAYFRENPEALSFPLGTNDNRRYGDSASLRAAVRPLRYFRDQPDYSDLYFGWLNRVAERVAEEFPDRYLGALAYMWTENVPSFPVHPQVLPYLTADRAQGAYDGDFAAEDRALVEAWAEAGPRLLGLWEYPSPGAYEFPRRADGEWLERVRESRRAGIRAYYGRVSPVWPFQGSFPWRMARTLWDVEEDPAELRRVFLDRFFGPAAEAMGAFYARAEAVWSRQGGRATWLKYYRSEAGVRLFTKRDRRRMAGWLAEAERRTVPGSVEARRVAAVVRAWRLVEAAAGREEAAAKLLRVHTLEDWEAVFPRFLEVRRQWRGVREELRGEEWTRGAAERLDFVRANPTYHAARQVLGGADPAAARTALTASWREARAVGDGASALLLGWALLGEEALGARRVEEVAGPGKLLVRTGAEPWEYRLRAPLELSVRPSERVRLEQGEGGALRIADAYAAGVGLRFPAGPGDRAFGEVELAARSSWGNRTRVALYWEDARGNRLARSTPVRLPGGGGAAEEYRGTVEVAGRAPEGTAAGILQVDAVRQERGDWLEVERFRVAFPGK